MPSKEIKELRKAGKLEEALAMAQSELDADPGNIWAKRNIGWVYYEYLKVDNHAEQFDAFLDKLNSIAELHLPEDEKMIFDSVGFQVGVIVFSLAKLSAVPISKVDLLFKTIQPFYFSKPSEGYSFLLKAFHKVYKDTNKYITFVDWWNLSSFRDEDFEKEKLPNDKEVMALVEQVYIAYAKHLLPQKAISGALTFDKLKVESFLPLIDSIVENYPKFQYPVYFKAKLLLALGDTDNDVLASFLPFARRKKNDFWVWEIFAEIYKDNPEVVFACYCKALSCFAKDEMLVKLRQKMASILVRKGLHNEAKTEIQLLLAARTQNHWPIPNEVSNWLGQNWYTEATSSSSNINFYKNGLDTAESLLFADAPEETVIVEFVNSDGKMLNFIGSESKYGFFKYERFLRQIQVGDTLRVRFQSGTLGGIYQVHTVKKIDDPTFRNQFVKEIEGDLRISEGKSFGFVSDAYVHPTFVSSRKMVNGMFVKGSAIKSFNKEKNQWGWKLFAVGE
jgi:tetratricopeptide (TPR) repeat protein